VSFAQDEATMAANESEMNIVEVATEAGDFDTLVSAIQAAGLNDTLSGPGTYTVFAPTNEAFAKIPREQLDELITNESQRDMLRGILAYHVVPGRVMSSDLMNGTMLRTMEGRELRVTIDAGRVMVDGANVVQPDINASNGVIHAIDTVLMPSAVSALGRVEEEVGAVVERDEERAEAAVGRENATAEPAETQPSQPGFEAALAAAGILAVAFLALRRRD
ncbi:MAG TPA: fasciclin domain-containing protein, partial [Methanotrichaceae archaeon]|nr:fasciclin domain-containing protein [Methanotrichaceae archaeon]